MISLMLFFQSLMFILIGDSVSYKTIPSLRIKSSIFEKHRKDNSLIRCSMHVSNEDFVPTSVIATEFSGPGCVLLSQPSEYDHFLIRSAVLIFEHNEKGTLGVILDKPSAFTMGESSPNIGLFQTNTLFMGGNVGSNTALMIHLHDLGGYAKYLGRGLYIGGIRQARESVEALKTKPREFKFIFNQVQWGPGQLEKEISIGRWDVCALPPSLAVQQEPNSRPHFIWTQARNSLRSQNTLIDPTKVEDS